MLFRSVGTAVTRLHQVIKPSLVGVADYALVGLRSSDNLVILGAKRKRRLRTPIKPVIKTRQMGYGLANFEEIGRTFSLALRRWGIWSDSNKCAGRTRKASEYSRGERLAFQFTARNVSSTSC